VLREREAAVRADPIGRARGFDSATFRRSPARIQPPMRDEFAPSWWTLADAAGNEADIATTKGRD
jgi:hypothetical protein